MAVLLPSAITLSVTGIRRRMLPVPAGAAVTRTVQWTGPRRPGSPRVGTATTLEV
ncbi:hypothetical protein [Streptomyces sp. enrichment culture]|uniref:hypothetical protein n=1 Tax=Streptomyces sp. enrichment culture TaxID=1795815 RepID=UPI003F56A6DF